MLQRDGPATTFKRATSPSNRLTPTPSTSTVISATSNGDGPFAKRQACANEEKLSLKLRLCLCHGAFWARPCKLVRAYAGI